LYGTAGDLWMSSGSRRILYVMTDENDEVRQPYSENVLDVYAMLQLDPSCCCIVKVREKLIHNLDGYLVEFCDVIQGCL
jgi:DNA-dependent RNA polymerase auxiliary subunit epsilon